MPSNPLFRTRPPSRLWPLVTALLALWLPVFYRLSFFWESDEQYSHGWFVPLLAGWIFYTRWQTLPIYASTPASNPIPFPPLTTRRSSPATVLLFFLLIPLAAAYFVAEANPNWRMMLWIMALCAFSGSLLLTWIAGGASWTRHLWFAFFFALVSVPWPYSQEKWLTLELSMLAARISSIILSLVGIPAVCAGNTITLSAGVLGVNEACSGIRSFQSSLMAGLFLGELYMLRFTPRILLCLAGLAIAYALNVARMLVLSITVESSGSMDAIGKWHDPAGFAILLITIALLWLLCALMAKLSPTTSAPSQPAIRHTTPASRHLSLVTASVLAAMLLMTAGTEAWFRYKERNLVLQPDWHVAPPEPGSNMQNQPLNPSVETLLGQDEGFQRLWTDTNGRKWHLIFLRWLPGNIKGEGGPHAPDLCQAGAGRTITAKSEERHTQANGISLPYYLYTINTGTDTFYLMYVLNDDRFDGKRIEDKPLQVETHRMERLHRALAGRRKTGNRSLQLALVGVDDATKAEQAMLEMLPGLIRHGD